MHGLNKCFVQSIACPSDQELLLVMFYWKVTQSFQFIFKSFSPSECECDVMWMWCECDVMCCECEVNVMWMWCDVMWGDEISVFCKLQHIENMSWTPSDMIKVFVLYWYLYYWYMCYWYLYYRYFYYWLLTNIPWLTETTFQVNHTTAQSHRVSWTSANTFSTIFDFNGVTWHQVNWGKLRE